MKQIKKILIFLTLTFLLALPAHAQQITKIVVNKSLHSLTVYAGEEVIGSYDIIHGKPKSPTPTFTTTFSTIDINPTWNPTTKSQNFMRSHPKEIPAHGIQYKPDGTMYSPPGPRNPLGKARLNLMFGPPPIRIHGTSEPELFNTASRQYSSGCIRVLKIQDLVQSLVDTPIEWDRAYSIKLKQPIEVIVE